MKRKPKKSHFENFAFRIFLRRDRPSYRDARTHLKTELKISIVLMLGTIALKMMASVDGTGWGG